MAVITRFIVVRNGVELDKVFDVKKEADAYDKMLDAAENLAAFIRQSKLPVDLDAKTIDDISIYLAKNGPEVTRILRGVKPLAAAAPAKDKIETPTEQAPVKTRAAVQKPKAKRKKK